MASINQDYLLGQNVIFKMNESLEKLNKSDLDDNEFNEHFEYYLMATLEILDKIVTEYWHDAKLYLKQIEGALKTRNINDVNKYLVLLLISDLTQIDDYFINCIFKSDDGKLPLFNI